MGAAAALGPRLREGDTRGSSRLDCPAWELRLGATPRLGFLLYRRRERSERETAGLAGCLWIVQSISWIIVSPLPNASVERPTVSFERPNASFSLPFISVYFLLFPGIGTFQGVTRS